MRARPHFGKAAAIALTVLAFVGLMAAMGLANGPANTSADSLAGPTVSVGGTELEWAGMALVVAGGLVFIVLRPRKHRR